MTVTPMTPADFAILRLQVKTDEGLRLKPYTDTVGKISIGYGRNLTDTGITQLEAADMLEQDLTRVVSELPRAFPITVGLDPVRQIVLCNMLYNLGATKLAGFVMMWAAITAGNYEQAAIDMLNSRWAEQVGARATRLAEMMRSGELK